MARNSAPVMALPCDAQLLGDRLGGDGVVAGDHPDLDPGAVGLGDRLLGRRPRRVDDADEGQEGHPVEERQEVRVRVEGRRVEVLAPGRHDPQALRAEALVLVEERRSARRRRPVGCRPGRA